jgi:hypothetical protein
MFMSTAVALAEEPQSPGNECPCGVPTYVGLLILAALPLLVLALCDEWSVTPPGLIDPWVYFGYYQNLPEYLTIFDGTYYGTRLSTLLPGYAAYHCLPPLAAHYLLHLGLYYACVVSLYLILARTVSPRAGLLAATCLGCQYFFLKAIGGDYVDGFAIAYFFVSVLALTAAAHSRYWKGSLVAAGGSSAAFVIANAFYVIYLPYFIIHYLYVNRQARGNSLLGSLGLYLLGATSLTLALCLYSGWAAGRFWFLGPTLQFARSNVVQANPYLAPVSTWLLGADWLVLPALTALGSLYFLYRFRSSLRPLTLPSPPVAGGEGRVRGRRTAVLYQVQFLFMLAMMIGWQWWERPDLQCQEYASLLLPATLLALGSQLAPHIERLSVRQYGVLLWVVLLALLAPYALKNSGEWLVRLSPWSGGLTVAVGLLGFTVLAFRQPGAVSAAGIVALFVSIPAFVARHTFDFSKTLPCTEFFHEATPLRREHYQVRDVLCSVFDAVRVVQKWDPTSQARFWYHYRAPMGKVCTAVSSTYLWGYRLVNFEFPALGDPAAFGRLQDQRVLILSADPEALVKANTAMKKLGLEAHLLAAQHIAYPSVAFTMSYVAIRAKGRFQQPLVARFEQGTNQAILSAISGTVTAAEDHVPLSLDQWHPCYDPPQMSLARTDAGLQVVTARERWAYALLYSPLRVLEEGTYRFELHYILQNGDIAFGALTEDQSRWLSQAGPASAPPPPEKPGTLVKSFSLCLKAGQGFRLLLTNNHPSGSHPSQVLVHEVRAFRETSISPSGNKCP